MKLNKKALIIITITSVLVLGGVLWALNSSEPSQPDQPTDNSTVNDVIEEPASEDHEEAQSDRGTDDTIMEEEPTEQADDRGGYTPY